MADRPDVQKPMGREDVANLTVQLEGGEALYLSHERMRADLERCEQERQAISARHAVSLTFIPAARWETYRERAQAAVDALAASSADESEEK